MMCPQPSTASRKDARATEALVLLRALIRRDGLSLVAWGALLAVQGWGYTGYEGTIDLLIDLLFVVLFGLLMVVVLIRCGLLGFSAMHFVLFASNGVPFVFDGSPWWAPRGWAILAVLATLGVWAFRTSLGGKPAFGDWLET